VTTRPDLLLAVDQGTTSTRAVAFDRDLRPIALASRPVERQHPQPGWVEVDPMALLDGVVEAVAEVLTAVGGAARIAATGLDNQGETVVAWDAADLRPLAPAITWQCRRSLSIVEELREAGLEPGIRAATGLPLDPYYSASKLTWLARESGGVRRAARARRLRFGTVDAWLTANLGNAGPAGRTDHSTASRTQLLDLRSLDWGDELLGVFGVDRATLPELCPTAGRLGALAHPRWGGHLQLTAMACDQQAALAGHGGFRPGAIKVTYGTGAFGLANAGSGPTVVDGLETSVGWTGVAGGVAYVLQGGVLSAASLVDWLRDNLKLIADAASVDALARSVPDAAGVRVLPALSGIGSPWYRPDARGVVAGLGSGVTRAHVARAALDGIAQRVADVIEAMLPGLDCAAPSLRVDGGLTASDYLLQRQADLLGLRVERVAAEETTSLGIAALAGVGARVLEVDAVRAANPVTRTFQPSIPAADRRAERAAWRAFVERASEL
jgi:glycerol kinase